MYNPIKIITVLLLCTLFSFANEKLKKVTLQLSWFDQFQFAGYYMAKEKGFYKQLGLDVEIRPFKFGLDIPQDIHDNKINFAIGRETLILQRANNKKIVALYALFQSSPLVLLSTKVSQINSIADFKGKKIMTTIDDASEVSLKAMLNSKHINLKELNFLKHSHNIDDLITKKTDIISAYISKTTYDLQQKGVPYNIFEPKNFGFDMYSDFLFTSETLISKDPKLVQDFTKASLQGWKYAYENIKESSKFIFNQYNPQNITEDALIYEAKELKKLSYYNNKILGQMNQSKIQRIVDLYSVMGLIPKRINANEFMYDQSNYNLKFTKEERHYLQKKKTITLCVNSNFMPYEYIDEKNNYLGLISDYFKKFNKEISIPMQILKSSSFADSLALMKDKSCDLLSMATPTQATNKIL
ncbi:MAG: ABC transporter substrate-binding protein, partial [Campylobacteraceae bacterium]|nr:ABC transporter substrate-binding protein [Campylobacteraceae bacterium]